MPEYDPPDPNSFQVGEAEAGQKLLRYLERRLNLPANLLHRWLRTGQIRLNGKRCKPFEIVAAGDSVRVPPFAGKLAANAGSDIACEGELPPLIGASGGVLAFDKPAGLAVQPGTGQERSLAGLLRKHYGKAEFCPAPAHRLDLETSGVLLVGATFEALRNLQAWFAAGAIHKEYLAWVSGEVPWLEAALLRHYLTVGKDAVTASIEPASGAKEALCIVRPLLDTPEKSLLQIRLLTGRKRQIRAQLAACGHPVIGDQRYGGSGEDLKLHSCRAILPDGVEFISLPPWRDEYAVSELPPSIPESTCDKLKMERS